METIQIWFLNSRIRKNYCGGDRDAGRLPRLSGWKSRLHRAAEGAGQRADPGLEDPDRIEAEQKSR